MTEVARVIKLTPLSWAKTITYLWVIFSVIKVSFAIFGWSRQGPPYQFFWRYRLDSISEAVFWLILVQMGLVVINAVLFATFSPLSNRLICRTRAFCLSYQSTKDCKIAGEMNPEKFVELRVVRLSLFKVMLRVAIAPGLIIALGSAVASLINGFSTLEFIFRNALLFYFYTLCMAGLADLWFPWLPRLFGGIRLKGKFSHLA